MSSVGNINVAKIKLAYKCNIKYVLCLFLSYFYP